MTYPTAAVARLQALTNADYTDANYLTSFAQNNNDLGEVAEYVLTVATTASTTESTMAGLLSQAQDDAADISSDKDDAATAKTAAEAAQTAAEAAQTLAELRAADLTATAVAFLYTNGDEQWQLA